MAKRIKITKIMARTGEMAYQLQSLHFSQFKPPATGWVPDMNAYAYDDRYVVCVDLAGVEEDQIELMVEPRKMTLRGARQPPRPCEEDDACRQVLMLEIETGPFKAELPLARNVTPERVTARQNLGMLWITMYYENPIRYHA